MSTPQEEITAIREALQPISKTPEENKTLCEKYPFLKWYGDPLYVGYDEEHELDYKYTWEDEIPDGWRKAFCPQIWDELKAILEQGDYLDKFRFSQIKEKFGTIRLYHCGVPEEIFNEIIKWESKWEKESAKTCIDCGAPATHMSTGWINFICRDCARTRAAEQEKHYGGHDHFVKIENIDEFYNDREAYWKKHKDEEI